MTQIVSPSHASLIKLSLVGLLGMTLDLIFWQQQAGLIIPSLLIIAILYLGCAGMLVAHWRWAAAVSSSVIIVTMLVILAFSKGYTPYHITHPQEYGLFAVSVLYIVLGIFALGNTTLLLGPRDHHPLHIPVQWITSANAALAGVAASALLLGAIIAPTNGQYSRNSGVNQGAGAVHATMTRFSPNIIALHQGDSLTIIADTSVQHNLMNGTWENEIHPTPMQEPGAPSINNLPLNSTNTTIGPFLTPGTFHVFCTIHPGMELTIVVVSAT